jgi:predicted AlkP superfamily pyrophosphatase or phosphodiesterase
VVLFSLDGQAAEAFSARTMPRVWRLAQMGQTGRALPPFPSTTFNGHATLATGCWPEHHGIIANGFVDPELGEVPYGAKADLLQREPLWVAATRSGVKTAVFNWPCGDTAWQGVDPAMPKPYRGRQEDREALAFVDHALAGGASLVMAYLTGIDSEGHNFGPESPEVRRKLLATDRLLAPWLRRTLAAHPGLRIVLTGDHGMATMKRRVSLGPLLEDLHPHLIAHGGSAYVYLPKPLARLEAAQRLRAEGLEVWERASLPDRFHLKGNPRVGDLVVLAQVGTWLSTTGALEQAEGRAGAHAYSPEEPAMQSWLVVLGAGKGNLGKVPLWDIAPTLASWLNIRWAQEPDGRPVAGLRKRPLTTPLP